MKKYEQVLKEIMITIAVCLLFVILSIGLVILFEIMSPSSLLLPQEISTYYGMACMGSIFILLQILVIGRGRRKKDELVNNRISEMELKIINIANALERMEKLQKDWKKEQEEKKK